MKTTTTITYLSQKIATYVVLSLLGLTFVLLLQVFISTPKASAASLANWNAGRIIDDTIFTNNLSMSPTQIQQFLNSKVSSCDTNGTQPASEFGRPDLTHAQYAASRGWSAPPYTCLKDYVDGGKSSAQIIYDAAQEFSINPQVLIVLLQKEQSLVTDTWPLSTQYRSATGYGCPDTAPCDSQYYGLTNQIRWSGRMFRAIMNASPTWYTPYTVGNNYIRWSPNSSCGGSVVNILNRSTQALYNYTPYQPNQSALNAGYGTGDSCGAYGNRNFYLYFTDWFGPTLTSAFSWQWASQTIYSDATATQSVNYNDVVTGNRYFLRMQVRNTGSTTWSNGQVRLAPTQPQDRTSAIYDSTWLSPTRVVSHDQATVAPGETGTFSFWITVPNAGVFQERFNLVAEGTTWMNDNGAYWLLAAQPRTYTWQWVSQSAYTDQSKTTPVDLSSAGPDQRYYLTLQAKNTGNVPWQSSWTRLATSQPQERSSILYDSTWPTNNRTTTLDQATVAPGETGTFSFWIKTPNTGTFKEYFNLVAEGRSWMNNNGLYWLVNVPPATYTWQWVSQSAHTDQTKTTTANLLNAVAGQRYYLTVEARNTSNRTWAKAQTRLGTSRPQDRSSATYDSTWLGINRAAELDQTAVAPGQIGTFSFWVKAPAPGTYQEYFNIVSEGRSWLNDNGLYWLISTH